MFGDITKCIECKANFAAALALSAYTDVLGGLITGNFYNNKKNYCAFLKRMEYNDKECEDFYKKVRCGLVHQYFIKEENSIVICSQPNLKGIVVNGGLITFIIENYFSELKKAYSEYKEELESGVDELRENFEKALQSGATFPKLLERSLTLKQIGELSVELQSDWLVSQSHKIQSHQLTYTHDVRK